MLRIDVIEDGGEFKILINFLQHGVTLHNAQFANQEAKKVKETHYPKAELHLAKEVKEKEVAKLKLAVVK